MEGSSMNIFGAESVQRTITVADPYKAYPAATCSVPGRSAFSWVTGPSPLYLNTEKMVPIETRQSMLLEPSKGSKQTMYFPAFPVSITIAFSRSSETSKQQE